MTVLEVIDISLGQLLGARSQTNSLISLREGLNGLALVQALGLGQVTLSLPQMGAGLPLDATTPGPDIILGPGYLSLS